MTSIHIADGDEPRTRILEMLPAHAADSDHGLGQLIARRDISPAAEKATGDDGQGGRGDGGPFDEFTPGDRLSFHTAALIYTGKQGVGSREAH